MNNVFYDIRLVPEITPYPVAIKLPNAFPNALLLRRIKAVVVSEILNE